MTDAHDPRVGTNLGPYHIESVIGRGGMGVVYLAEQPSLERKVAVKILAPAFASDAGFRSRFINESKMAAAIDDPNILPVYEAGEIDGQLFIAMRYVEGSDLEARLRSGELTAPSALRVLDQVASALDAAHDRGLIHRDVKPANILIADRRAESRGEHAYLADFGLTKSQGAESGLTRIGSIAGTLDYIAPEQLSGRTIDGRADQYALAAIAFRAVTGHLPFERDTDVAIIAAHLNDPPPSARAIRADLPMAVDAVIARGMAKEPADRFPNCADFVTTLRAALDPTGAKAPTAAAGRRTWPRLAAVGVGLVVIAALGAAIVAGSGAFGGAAPTVSGVAEGAASGDLPIGGKATPAVAATRGPYPDAAESALLELLPSVLVGACERGSYAAVQGDIPNAGTGGALGPATNRLPLASLACPQAAASGANLVQIRDFGEVTNLGKTGVTVDGMVSAVASKQGTTGGECSRDATRVNGRWAQAGVDAGAIVCFTDPATGDAVLYWSYEGDAILVRAVNQRGDTAGLYDYFLETARFIAP
jgi:serine/threonine-protein kinase